MIKLLILFFAVSSGAYSKSTATFKCEGTVTTITEIDAFVSPNNKVYGYDGGGIYIDSMQIPCNVSPAEFRENKDIRFILCDLEDKTANGKIKVSIEIDKIKSGIFDFRLSERRSGLKHDSIVSFQGLCGYAD